MKVALIGPRGAGKSTVAQALAREAGVPCVDTDQRIVERTGRAISELFADGSFRSREREIVGEALAMDEGVVALGGGAVLWKGIDEALAGWSVVLLTAEAEVLAERIRAQGIDRPSLTGAPADEEIAAVSAERANRYSGLADFSVATDNLDEGVVARLILARLRNR